MAIEKSEAIVLKTYNWAESSRTVVFFTYTFGRLSLINKGGRSIKSKRGRIIPFTRMEITFYHSEKESRGYISEIEIVESFSFEKDGTLGRLAYGSAACELLLRLLPEEHPQPQLFNYFISFLKIIEKTEKKYLVAVFIAFYLRLLSQLGYHPSLAYCASCGKDLHENSHKTEQSRKTCKRQKICQWQFGINKGGIVCKTCQKLEDDYISFSEKSYKLLWGLQTASLIEAAAMPISLKDAGGLLDVLTRFVSNQTGLNMELKSLAFIEKLKTVN